LWGARAKGRRLAEIVVSTGLLALTSGHAGRGRVAVWRGFFVAGGPKFEYPHFATFPDDWARQGPKMPQNEQSPGYSRRGKLNPVVVNINGNRALAREPMTRPGNATRTCWY